MGTGWEPGGDRRLGVTWSLPRCANSLFSRIPQTRDRGRQNPQNQEPGGETPTGSKAAAACLVTGRLQP